MRTVILLGAVLGMLTWGPAVAVAAPVDVTLTSDANGEVASISLLGRATCTSENSLTDPCLAASAGNDASAPCSYYMFGGCGIAVSGTGNSLGWISLAGLGTSTGIIPLSGSNQCRTYTYSAWTQCIAVAPSGDASGYWLSVAPSGAAQGGVSFGASGSEGTLAVSPTGPSHGTVGVSGTESSYGTLVAVSVTGDSETMYGSSSGVALTVGGDATGATPVSLLGTCNAVQCFAIVPIGEAEGYWLAVAGTGSATAEYVALSVFGDATGTVAATLRDVLCTPDAICIRP